MNICELREENFYPSLLRKWKIHLQKRFDCMYIYNSTTILLLLLFLLIWFLICQFCRLRFPRTIISSSYNAHLLEYYLKISHTCFPKVILFFMMSSFTFSAVIRNAFKTPSPINAEVSINKKWFSSANYLPSSTETSLLIMW